jgi:release factor glutamine methyltransferase
MSAIADQLRTAAGRLASVSETPRLDAELLMAHALGLERAEMSLRRAELPVPSAFEALVERRLAHEPVAYITRRQGFYGLDLNVTPDVLIPRSDSETLIDAAVAHFAPLPLAGGAGGGSDRQSHSPSPSPSRRREGNLRILDLGTGSGALLLAALSVFPEAHGTGIDASEAALTVARGNAARLGLAPRTQWLNRNWRESGWQDGLSQFDLLLCNPPYVEESADLAPMVQLHEPHSALFAGPEGLDDYRLLLPTIPALLAHDGIAIFEIGHEQAEAVAKIGTKAGLTATLHHDLAGKPRALRFSLGIGLAKV